MPSVATHIHRRGGLYHLRCRVPKDLVQIVGRHEIRRSLCTASPSQAKVQAAKLYVRLSEAFDQIRQMDNPKDELIHLLLEVTERQEAIGHLKLKAALTQRDLDEVRYLTSLAEAEEKQSLRLQVLGAKIEALAKEADSAVKNASPAFLAAKMAEVKAMMRELGLRPRPATTPTVTEYLEQTYMEERKLQDDARRHIENYVRIFARVTGDKMMGTYERSDVVGYVRVLEVLKASLGKSPKDAELEVDDMIRLSKGKPTFSATTIEKHVQHVKAFFATAARALRFADSDEIDFLFDDVELSEGVPKAQKRKTWSIDQLNALFASPVWAGTASGPHEWTRRHEPGDAIHRDAYWWLPPLALWTGARLEELAQLHHEDLKRDRTGIPFILIHDEGVRRVKTEHSIRSVPVHPELVRMGFPDLFKASLHGERIFPELQPTGRLQKFGDTYSSHFTDYRRHCGLYERWRDFHSFRRTFITAMRTRAKIDLFTVAAIAGHDEELPELQRARQTEDYTDYDISVLAEAIGKLDYAAMGLGMEPFAARA